MKKIYKYLDVIVIVLFSIYVLLDSFVIPKAYSKVDTSSFTSDEEIESVEIIDEESNEDTLTEEIESEEIISTDNEYKDENIHIVLNTYRYENTNIYVADVTLSDISYMQSAFASNTYGKNVTAKTSEIAESVNAILAINGDYYGARDSGYVLRNGEIYRTTSKSNQEDLVIDENGNFIIINEDEVSLEELDNALQVYSFGPALIEGGVIAVSQNDEVGKAMASNPRTAICQLSELHYLFVVSDGRTNESEGLSLYELATFLKGLNVTTAYNLDGGGSSTMYFNGQVINKPTTSGRNIKERSVSDVICIK